MADHSSAPLRVGFIGSGFIAQFHLRSMIGVRNVEIRGVYSTTAKPREAFAAAVDEAGLGPCRAFEMLEAMLHSGDIDAVWLLSPNHTRVSTMEAIAAEKPIVSKLFGAREVCGGLTVRPCHL